jgi:hypothetical protein
MSNLNAPFGLSPLQYRNGNAWTGLGRLYAIAAADTNAFYIGDPVKIVANTDANGIPIVTLGTAGASLRGVVMSVGTAVQGGFLQGGPFVNPQNLQQNYRPSGAQTQVYYAMVVDDPDVVFSIMENSGTPGVAANIAGKNANFIYAAPATGVYVSGVTLDPTTYATTATLNLRLLGAVQDYQNLPFTANQRLMVTINNHDFSGGTSGT